MKIVYIIPYNSGGLIHYTAELANAVSKYADVTVIGGKSIENKYFCDRVKIIRIFEDLIISTENFWKIFTIKNVLGFLSFRKVRFINDLHPDIVHLTTPLIPFLSIALYLFNVDSNCQIILTKHGVISVFSFKRRLIEELLIDFSEKLIQTKKIIVHTKKDKFLLTRAKCIDENKIAVIPHGAYTFFKCYEKSILPEDNCILFFGNITENKGLEILIQAVPIIFENIDNLKIIIAGQGDISKYISIINKVGQSSFEIYNDFIPDEKVCEIFQRSQIVVLPYTKMSGQSGVLNIACAFNKPVVATSVGSFSDVVENGITGLIVPPSDPKALGDAIVKILKDRNIMASMEINMKKKSHDLSWDKIADKHINIYKESIINQS